MGIEKVHPERVVIYPVEGDVEEYIFHVQRLSEEPTPEGESSGEPERRNSLYSAIAYAKIRYPGIPIVVLQQAPEAPSAE